MLRLLAIGLALAACSPAVPAPQDSGDCTYDAFEGTCRLTDVWVDEDHGTVEAGYDTPRGPHTVRHTARGEAAERLRKHLAGHPRVPCTGRVVRHGTCDPFELEVDLPPP